MKITTSLFLSILLTPTLFAASKIPLNPKNDTLIGAGIFVRKKVDHYSFVFQAQHHISAEQSNQKVLQIGTRYRIHKNQKIGFFLSREHGHIHDQDWILKNGLWQWDETTMRTENFGKFEWSPRFLWTSKPILVKFRNRFIYNFFNKEWTYKLRPSLTWFFSNESGPTFNLETRAEFYFPLNYGEKLLYEKWFYLSLLYHYSETFKVAPSIAYGSQTWTQTEAFKNKTGLEYEFTTTSLKTSMDLIFNF